MPDEQPNSPAHEPRAAEGEAPRGKGGNRNKQQRSNDGGEDRKRRRSGGSERKGTNGFADGVERAYCLVARSVPAVSFPIQFRTGIATIAPIVVGKRDGAILYCDCPDHAVHFWPDGELASDPVD
jgi:hypothetical protein